MYLIGIDISKYKHDCFIATEAGEIIRNIFSFENNKAGFDLFLDVLNQLDQNQEIRIGLEATGHYGKNLKLLLDKNNFQYMEFNPYKVKRFATGLSLRKTKTDKSDSKLLSMILLNAEFKPYPIKSYHINDLKSLSRFYRYLVDRRSREYVNLTNILDISFPELKPFFNNDFSKTALYIINNYRSADKISNLNSVSFEKIRKVSSYSFSFAKFTRLKELAKNTIGYCSIYILKQLDFILQSIKVLTKQIDSLKSYLTKIIKKLNPPTLSIRGVGYLSALSIVTEYSNFDNFDSPDKMLSFAGLEPSVIESGTLKKTGKMVKRGSPHLRETIMNSSTTFMIHNPVIYSYYHKKRLEGKSHRVALTHVAKKLVRIIYHLEKNHIKFDSDKLR